MAEEMNKKSVLIVDDETIVRESLQDWLRSFGHEVAVAADGKQALQMIQEQEYGVVVLDLILPDMNGNEVLAEARKYRPGIKGIIITAYPSKDTVVDAMRLGAVDYLVKPFEPEELEELIKKVLEGEQSASGQDLTIRGSLSALVSEWKKQKESGEKPATD